MEDKIQPYRQPLVTATGIILGFILNFASTWVKTESSLSDALAYFVGFCVLTGVVMLIYVLFRVLRMPPLKEDGAIYYKKTLRYFIIALSLAFVGVFVDMFANFMEP